MREFAEVCLKACEAGAAELRSWRGRFQTREKGRFDLVTEADVAAEEAIRETIAKAFPDHQFVGEESSAAEGERARQPGDYSWLVDPLDGTVNYAHGVPHYATSVALVRDEELLAGAIIDPSLGECFTAEPGKGAWLNGKRIHASRVTHLSGALVAASFPAGVLGDAPVVHEFLSVLPHCQAIRRIGSAAINLAYIAAGRFDALWASDLYPWDAAAGVLLVREAGGYVTSLSGGPFSVWDPNLIATSTPELHANLRQALRPS